MEVVGLPKPFISRALLFSAKAFIPVEKLTEKLDNMVGTGLLESPEPQEMHLYFSGSAVGLLVSHN